ncbi:hypothetical protein CDAR_231961 [Caerostris darwini]|uniref:Uncharacterized protein n=1 Tax=Caerostris darwini TaxID=1538125 RepID=A0AAV4W1S9_9ARAC|nr:hypothetical protein CDAR_231961 [Caerostris darwini]
MGPLTGSVSFNNLQHRSLSLSPSRLCLRFSPPYRSALLGPRRSSSPPSQSNRYAPLLSHAFTIDLLAQRSFRPCLPILFSTLPSFSPQSCKGLISKHY